MDWTLEYDGEEKTFAAWGLEGLDFAFQSFAVSSATFQGREVAFDAAAQFAVDEPAIIRAGGTIIFQGLFAPETRTGAGPTSSITYRIVDAWYELERRFYVNAEYALPQLAGAIDAGIATVIAAAAAAGVNIAMGDADNLGAYALKLEFRDQTFASMLQQFRRLIPDVATRIDYTTTPPTLHFVRRADADALTLSTDGADAWDGLDSMQALHEAKTSGVVLRFVRQGESITETFEDVYPVGTTAGARGVVLATFDLRPATVQTQELTTTNINATSKAWWAKRFPWVNDATGSGFVIDTTSRKVMSGGAWVDDTGGLTNEITSGAVPNWAGTAVSVLVTATARNFTLNGQSYTSAPLQCTVQATSIAGGLYAHETAAGETAPAGLAQAYYEATSVLHYQGAITKRFDALTLPLPHTANVVNFSGGNASARGWSSMRAVVQNIRVNAQTGAIEIALGPPAHLSIQDLLQLARMHGQGREVQPTPTSGGGISGGAGSNSMPAAPAAPAVTTPLTVKLLSSDGDTGTFTVTPGLLSGQPVRANSLTGDPISNLDPPEWNIETGRLYLAWKFSPTFEDGFMSDGGGTPIAYVVSAASVLSDDKTAGLFYQLLANISGGEIVDDFSPKKNVVALYGPSTTADQMESYLL